MSIFQMREWWSCPSDSAHYNMGALCVGSLSLNHSSEGEEEEKEKSNVVCAGSFEGLLRIYAPSANGFSPNDLLLEQQLGAPILQLELGRFLSDASSRALAVLHPQSLDIYAAADSPIAEHPHLALDKSFSCALGDQARPFTAYSFTFGCLGAGAHEGASVREVFAVQSVDGQIHVMEANGPICKVHISDLLLPAPLAYLPSTDCLVTGGAQGRVRAYLCGRMSESHPMAHWAMEIGEEVIELRALCVYGEQHAVVLGERGVYLLGAEDGRLKHQLRLPVGFMPMCCLSFGDAFNQRLIVSSTNAHSLIFHRNKLIWSAANKDLSAPPVAHAVASFAGTEGFLLTMDGNGKVVISFMGTQPPVLAIDDHAAQSVSAEDVRKEREALQARVKKCERSAQVAASNLARIAIRAEVPSGLDKLSFEDNALAMDEADTFAASNGTLVQLTLRLFFSYFGIEQDLLPAVHVALALPESVVASRPSFVVSLRKHAEEKSQFEDVTLRVLRTHSILPRALDVDILATWNGSSHSPVVSRTRCRLPLCISGEAASIDGGKSFKVTLQTNRDELRLPVLFKDVAQVEEEGKNAVGLSYLSCGKVVSILGSNRKYRIQSVDVEALPLAVEEVLRRVRENFTAKGEEVNIAFLGNLPLADLATAVDEHYAARTRLVELDAELNDRSQLYRMVEKRVLSVLGDRHAGEVDGLDWMLTRTHGQVLEVIEALEEGRDRLEAAQRKLAAVVNLVWILAKERYSLEAEEWKMYRRFLSESVEELDNNCEQHGWEEYTLAQLTHLFREINISKRKREKKDLTIKTLRDTETLKKGIRKLFAHLESSKTTTEEKEE